MQNYGTARSTFSLVEFVSWAAVIIGILIALMLAGAAGKSGFMGSARGATAFIAAMPGMVLVFLGFLGVLFCQIGRATVDSAEYGQQMLKIARDQLEVSKQALRQSNDMVASFASLKVAPEASAAAPTASFRRAFAEADNTENQPQKNGRAAIPEAAPDLNTIVHGGQKIVKHEGLFWIEKTAFKSVDLAKAHIDGQSAPEPAKSSEVTTYNGKQIIKKDGLFCVDKSTHRFEADAKQYIDRLAQLDQTQAARKPEPAPALAPTISYEGHLIKREKGGFMFGGQFFSDLEAAKRAIDERRKSAIQRPPY